MKYMQKLKYLLKLIIYIQQLNYHFQIYKEYLTNLSTYEHVKNIY